MDPMNAWMIKVAVLGIFFMYYGYLILKTA